MTASGKHLSRGMVASPSNIPFGTKIYIKEFNKIYTVQDRGNSNYIKWIDNNTVRLDIYVSSKEEAYRLGIIKTKGYIMRGD